MPRKTHIEQRRRGRRYMERIEMEEFNQHPARILTDEDIESIALAIHEVVSNPNRYRDIEE